MKEKLLMHYRRQQGFTLLELLVVLMIIALLAGFVGPRLFSQVDQAKDKTALNQMKSLSDALSQYRLDVGQYPSETQGLKALIDRPSGVTGWRGPYLSKSVPNDPWGNPYQWHNPTRNKNAVYEVELLATGNDGKTINYGF
ncbi:type II secretion system major pseudopilin GspG [Serratia symbiotica]|uniref:Type II secretion system core protein G n=1 Tax=Serratia symbiotica TaxID=138074 RepID=A0A068Z2W2_9GAMM|nr:type II secretion system major pseudopilin GspG [Serratia symbiotica]MBF1994352.1 type II secretion system major pseudopilin GspG [Serratia symbiotica]MBQ0954818.1 type II secretion system major pseudopilin GspG [Serratia symbiotica]QLH63831.1 type II secretion system major pseudopilin GspG [Serratia symbiotica]QTP14271.1 type II secretion system major pseudopilin GspG [Serratia symbiotica]CDS55483.1 Type II secretion system protein G [Serratia symbiotica]